MIGPSLTTVDSDSARAKPSHTWPPRRINLLIEPDSTQTWHHTRVPQWIDTHVHWDRYGSAERAVLLTQATGEAVVFISVGVDIESSKASLALDGAVGAVVGVHPKFISRPFEKELRELARDPKVVAIGECGFDAAGPGWEIQALAFALQWALARALALTVVLHIDGEVAWEQLRAAAASLDGLSAVRPYFTGDELQADWHRARGHYLSFGNPLRREPRLREIARQYPPDLLLIETDSYPATGRNTEPAHVAKVGESLALVHGWTFAHAREQLAANTRAAFRVRVPG